VSKNKEITITVVTATFNAELHLPRLVKSLEEQTDPDFEWVVADGGSVDDTLKILNSSANKLRNVKVSTRTDFGIYDALNGAIQNSTSEYYLVVGADDWLESRCIENFKKSMREQTADIYTAAIAYENGGVKKQPRKARWLYGMGALVTGHSVGSVYRKSLHLNNGFYSKKYPIAADCYFVLEAYKSGSSIRECNFLAGYFGQGGVSSVDVLGSICELYRIQIAMGENKFIQTIILFLRLLKVILR
jgi:glycosyltransferase involved in cell wall biosynthesis